ncbi:MAG TPA: hypothetical protein PKU95_01900 [Candidatus Dojkabacteria bacterium]|nr:hypothetical protein [Candidatus Dojkabacteria bacterium]
MKKFLLKIIKENWLIITLITFLSSLFFLTYPAGYLSIDEHDYVEGAKLIWQGKLRQECDPQNISQIDIGDYCIYKYNIGTSFFLLPINLLGENAVYVIAHLAFIVSLIFFYLILKQIKLPKELIVFYALFPAITYYSRTAYSEIYSILLSLAFFYFYIKNRRSDNILAGVAMGISLFVRPTNLFFYAVFILVEVLRKPRPPVFINNVINLFLELLIGFTPFVILFLLFNDYLYLSPFKSGYSYSGDLNSFDLSLLPMNLLNYFILLNLFLPGMLIGAFFSKNRFKWPIILGFLVLLIFYSATSNNNWKSDINLIIGIRFLMPALPLVLLLYLDVIKNIVKGRLLVIITIVLSCIMILMQYMHFQYLNENVPQWLENHKKGMQDNELSWY